VETLVEEALIMLHSSFGWHLLEIGRLLCEGSGTETDTESVRKAGAVCTARMPHLGGVFDTIST